MDAALHDHTEIAVVLREELRTLRRVPGVVGALLATRDGHALCCDLAGADQETAAAITAASLGLAGRLSDLTGSTAGLQELQARSDTGYVCLYTIGRHWLLAVVTDLTANLALLKIGVRDSVQALASIESRVELGVWAGPAALAGSEPEPLSAPWPVRQRTTPR